MAGLVRAGGMKLRLACGRRDNDGPGCGARSGAGHFSGVPDESDSRPSSETDRTPIVETLGG
jgi:hypothetical protein